MLDSKGIATGLSVELGRFLALRAGGTHLVFLDRGAGVAYEKALATQSAAWAWAARQRSPPGLSGSGSA